MSDPVALLLLPHTLERLILYDQAADLLRSPGVHAVGAPRIAYGLYGRLPEPLAFAVGRAQARFLRLPGEPRALIVFHPFQWPVARALLARRPDCELWYARSDRYEHTPGARARLLSRSAAWHELVAERSDLTFAVSTPLVEAERSSGRDAILVPSAADSFPAPDPERAIVAVSFGHLTKRTDWALLRELAERLPELVVLLVGQLHERECRGDSDFRVCRSLPNFVWLGRRPSEEAARLIMCADIGLFPAKRDSYNEAALPNRIHKAARLGRKTITPDFRGVDVWSRAVVQVRDVDGWVQALREHRGARAAPDMELRAWGLAQTGAHQNAPLWERLGELGIAAAER